MNRGGNKLYVTDFPPPGRTILEEIAVGPNYQRAGVGGRFKEVSVGQWGQLKVNLSPIKLWVNNKKEQPIDTQKTIVILKSIIMNERSRHKKRTLYIFHS